MTQRVQALDKDWVDAYFSYGVDIDNRRVWLTGEITEDSAINVIKGLFLLDSFSQEPCELFISSEGGDLVETMAVYDIMQTLRCDVHTFAFGKCDSAAPLLLAAGTPGYRWVAANTEFMAHDFSTDMGGKGVELKCLLEQSCQQFERWLELLTKHSNMPVRHWRGLVSKRTDYYFSADQAIAWGVVDHIWQER